MAFEGEPLIDVAALQYRRKSTIRAFLRAAGYARVNDALLNSDNISHLACEGSHFFTDVNGKHCMAYNCYNQRDVDRAVYVATAHNPDVTIEYYRGPGDYDARIAKGNVSIHRTRVVIFRC